MVQTLQGDFIDIPVDKIHQLTKTSGTNLWLALFWAKDDPKKGYVLFFKYMAQLFPCNRLWFCKPEKTRADKQFRELP